MHYLFATYNTLFVLIDNVFQQIMVDKLPIKFLRIYISFFFQVIYTSFTYYKFTFVFFGLIFLKQLIFWGVPF